MTVRHASLGVVTRVIRINHKNIKIDNTELYLPVRLTQTDHIPTKQSLIILIDKFCRNVGEINAKV